MKTAALAVPACALLLTGCVGMSRSSAVAPLAADIAAAGRIDSVTLARPADLKVTGEFDAIFKARVKAKTDACATGARPLRLEASVQRLDKANVAMTAVIGGANVLRGQAKLIDVATGKTVGDYNIGKTIVGGRVGVIEMAQAEEQLSDAFGEELCAQAFPKAPAP
jgi:hypothetical protein